MTFSEMPFPQGVPCRLTALKIRPVADLGRDAPTIDRLLNPHGHGNGTHTAALANQVDNGPVSLPDLHVFNFQR